MADRPRVWLGRFCHAQNVDSGARSVVLPAVQVGPVEVVSRVGNFGLLPVQVVKVEIPQLGEFRAPFLLWLVQLPILVLGTDSIF